MRPLPPPLDPAAALFIDLDGTLIEIAAHPDLVRVPPQVPSLLERLARRHGGALAIVSGRRIDDIDRLLAPWHGAVAGLHGGERRRPDGSRAAGAATPAARVAAAALGRLRPQLAEVAARLSGVWLEDKGETLALHYREAPERETEIRRIAAALVREAGDTLRLIAGKMVVELQPRLHGKNAAIAAFLDEAPFRSRLPAFIGDDTTDEDGFAEVNRRDGLSVRVGDPARPTAAMYCLPSVAAALDWLSGNGTTTGRS